MGLLIVVGKQTMIPPDVYIQKLKVMIPGRVAPSYTA